MAAIIPGKYGLMCLLACIAVLALPAGIFAECRVIEYPDRNEVVCGEDEGAQSGQVSLKDPLKPETTGQKEYMFYAPGSPVTKIILSADLSAFAIASPGDQLLSYRAEVLMNRQTVVTSASIVFEERTEDTTFTIREDGSGERAGAPKITSVDFDENKNHLLLVPFKCGCPSGPADAIYLKMKSIEGSQLSYRIVLPACLSKLMEKSVTE